MVTLIRIQVFSTDGRLHIFFSTTHKKSSSFSSRQTQNRHRRFKMDRYLVSVVSIPPSENTSVQSQVSVSTSTSDSDNPFIQTQNPLFYPPVFLELSKYLRLSDLKNCRLVCKEWKDMAYSALRKRSRIVFYNSKAIGRFRGQARDLRELGNFRLSANRGDSPILETFNICFGNQVRELTIDCYFVLKSIIQFIVKNAGNVEALSLRFQSYTGQFIPPLGMPLMLVPATDFPKLRKLEVNQIPSTEINLYRVILDGARFLSEIRCTDRNVSGWIFDMLSVWSQTLKILQLGYVNLNLEDNKKKSFPVLNKLKKLDVMYWQLLVGINNLRNLEELVLQRSNLEIIFSKQMEPMLTVEKLRIEDAYRLGHVIQSLTILYPNIKILHFTSICNRSLRLVYRGLKSLQELTVGSGIMDMGVTGFLSNKHLPAIVARAEKNKDSFGIHMLRRYPFIGDLKNLTHFTITSKKITDLSVLLGIIHCKSLTSLRIERPVLTMKSLVLLADSLALQHLHIRVDSDTLNDCLMSSEMGYFRELHPNCQIEIAVHPPNPRMQIFQIGVL